VEEEEGQVAFTPCPALVALAAEVTKHGVENLPLPLGEAGAAQGCGGVTPAGVSKGPAIEAEAAEAEGGARGSSRQRTPQEEVASAAVRDRVEALAAEAMVEPGGEAALAACRVDLAAQPTLSDAQRAAVGAALVRRLTIVQGPPGTGKSTVAVHTLRLWARLGLKPLLATADCNVAVDNIAEGLLAQGVAVVRVGRGDKVSAAMEARSLDALTAARKQSRAAAQVAEAERRLAAELGALRERLRGMDAHELRAYAEQAGSGAPPLL